MNNFLGLSAIIFLSFLSGDYYVDKFKSVNFKDTTIKKKVVIYSSNQSFFEDYPIDSLVTHINLVNINPAVHYYANKQDNSDTGFAADYLVNIKMNFSQKKYLGPEIKTVRITKPVMVKISEGNGIFRHEITEVFSHNEDVIINRNDLPDKYDITLEAIRKNPYKRLKKLNLSSSQAQNNKSELVVSLIYNLQALISDN